MSDNVAQLSEAMAIMRTKDVQHLINRIKELEANAIANRVAIMRLEAKLAKAVDVDLIEQAVSDVLSEGGSYRDAAEYVARTTIAELKGDKTQ